MANLLLIAFFCFVVSAVSGRYLGQDPDLCNVRDIYHPVCAILHDELVDFPNEDEAECAGATILNEGYCSSVEPGELYPLPDIQQSGIPVPPIELHPLLPLAEKKKSMIKPKKKSFGGETKHFGQDFECNLREVYHPVCGIIRGELVDYPNEDYAECAGAIVVWEGSCSSVEPYAPSDIQQPGIPVSPIEIQSVLLAGKKKKTVMQAKEKFEAEKRRVRPRPPRQPQPLPPHLPFQPFLEKIARRSRVEFPPIPVKKIWKKAKPAAAWRHVME